MYFNSTEEILEIARRTGVAIFVVPKNLEFTLKNAFILKPEEKSAITIEQVKKVTSGLNLKQINDQFVIIRPAESMSIEASNAFLKNLEEPKEKVHFILITDSPSMLLPTIMSRAELYILKSENPLKSSPLVDEKTKNLAKRLMVAKPTELVQIAEEITKKRDGVRNYALEVIGTAIEMLYKTYFITEKPVFLKKIPNFLRLYESLAKNGHIKLQIVSNLC
ncbi:hypothetical protein IKG33_03610 [Candidatus Saccharibacteria bacterium]|nr:hypothetical protein [Candidatus Saccharibacteria bacterium]